MQTNPISARMTLMKTGDSKLTLAVPNEDVRGRIVRDSTGESIGEVSDLLLDEQQGKVRFLQVAAGGGLLGLGAKQILIPVEAVMRLDSRTVHIDQTREHLAGAQHYDPELTDDRLGYEDSQHDLGLN